MQNLIKTMDQNPKSIYSIFTVRIKRCDGYMPIWTGWLMKADWPSYENVNVRYYNNLNQQKKFKLFSVFKCVCLPCNAMHLTCKYLINSNTQLYQLYKREDVVQFTRGTRLEWAGHDCVKELLEEIGGDWEQAYNRERWEELVLAAKIFEALKSEPMYLILKPTQVVTDLRF
ncbi:hypothetical protein AGLY_014368 [Aphis glycines]|uniref:Uncharacterized protein n=1 Tax=Aphis glycines TaxID=307491 RepID=A0A6G0T3S4_APHGL|nr:hypothetical protein AGLY_014368 [Aphis glycines]